MSESGIDMERCLRGIDDEKTWVPEITWTICADEMPPDDAEVLAKYKGEIGKTFGTNVRAAAKNQER